MKKMMLILVMGMIFCRGIIDAEEVTKSTGTIKKPRLKLLWKKEFDGEVKCFSAFHDGSYIAVGMDKSKLNEEKSKYIYKKSEIILLDRKGKELWRREIGERLGLVKLGNTRPLVIVTNYQKIWVYDEEGNLIWEQFSKWTQGIPIISPDDKYIATVHTGIEGVTPRGLTVFDIKGNKLWNYNPVSSLNVVFIPFNAIFINRDMVAIVVSPICHHENSKKIVPDTSGKVIVFEVNNGKKIYEDTFEYLQDVYEINLEYNKNKNELKIVFGSYPKNGELIVPLKIQINNAKEQSKFFSSFFSVHEIDLPNISIKKVNRKQIVFYEKK